MAYISISILDADGNVNGLGVHVQDGLTLAEYMAFGGAFQQRVEDLTEGQIVACQISNPIPLDGGNKSAPVAGSNNQEGALFNFITEGRYSHSVRIPAFVQDKFAGPNVDIGDTQVSNFIDSMTEDTLGFFGTVEVHNGHGEDLLSLNRAVKSFRRK